MKKLAPTAILLVLVLLNLLTTTPLITTAEGIMQATPKILVYEVRVLQNETLTDMKLLSEIVLIVSNNEIIRIAPIGQLGGEYYMIIIRNLYRVKYDESRNTLLLEFSQPLKSEDLRFFEGLEDLATFLLTMMSCMPRSLVERLPSLPEVKVGLPIGSPTNITIVTIRFGTPKYYYPGALVVDVKRTVYKGYDAVEITATYIHLETGEKIMIEYGVFRLDGIALLSYYIPTVPWKVIRELIVEDDVGKAIGPAGKGGVTTSPVAPTTPTPTLSPSPSPTSTPVSTTAETTPARETTTVTTPEAPATGKGFAEAGPLVVYVAGTVLIVVVATLLAFKLRRR